MALDQVQLAERSVHEPVAVGVSSMAALGAITGLGALAASSCCVLPIALGSLGASAGVFTILGVLAPLYTPLMLVSVLAVIVGWFFYARRWQQAACEPDGSCPAPRRSLIALVLLSLATLLIAAAASWGHFEPTLIKMLRTA